MFDQVNPMRVKFQSHLLIRDTQSGEVLLDRTVDRPCVIYETTNLYNKKHNIIPYRYIGSDWNDNPNYFGSSEKLKEDISRLGEEWFEKKILLIFNKNEDLDNSTLRKKEADLLKELDVKTDESYYNLTDHWGPGGGKKGMKMPPRSEEHRENWRQSRTGSKWTEEQVNRRTGSGNPMYNRKHKAETLAKMSENRSGDKNPNALAWEITTPTGQILKVTSLKKWCRDNNVSYGTVYNQKRGYKVKKFGSGKGGPGKGKQNVA